jgi:BMFP domain-containing protein YqiC
VSTEYIWETFDSLFKTVHRQGLRVEELEARITDLERRLDERNATTNAKPSAAPAQPFNVNEMPAERAA